MALAAGGDAVGATSQPCKVTQPIWNVHDQPESPRRHHTIVNLLCPVEFQIISQPRLLDAQHQEHHTGRIVVTWDFGHLFDYVPVQLLTSDFDLRTPWKSLQDQRLWYWSADDQPESPRRHHTIVNLLCPVEFQIISQPRLLDAQHQEHHTGRIVVTCIGVQLLFEACGVFRWAAGIKCMHFLLMIVFLFFFLSFVLPE